MKSILVANAGSSSVKFQVFAVDAGGKLARLLKGQMDGIGNASATAGEPARREKPCRSRI